MDRPGRAFRLAASLLLVAATVVLTVAVGSVPQVGAVSDVVLKDPDDVAVTVIDADPENASIGDYVWIDQDGNGIQDGTETGLPGVIIYLDLDGNAIRHPHEPFATSDANGTYGFTSLAAGTYSVRIDAKTIPAGYIPTTANIPLSVTLAESEDYIDADFGYDDDPEDASIGDYVWFDQNGDGNQDETESGLPGVTVYLDLDGSAVLDPGEPFATSDANGAYDIASLAAGPYSVRIEPTSVPAGYHLTTANIPLTVILGVSEDYNRADFGFDDGPESASIGDYVWFDQNGDGIQDGIEAGLPGVVVYLDLNDSGTLDAGELSATTDAAGGYVITSLAAGTYSVRVDPATIPAGYNLTTVNIPLTVILAERQDYNDADFGYDDAEGASIGDYVWFDQDGDGIQDSNETGLSGITVYLDLDHDAARDAGEPSATTNGDGAYDITGLAEGTYSVRVDGTTVPAGYNLTTTNIPLAVTLSADEDYNSADFGFEGYTLTLQIIGNGSVIADPDRSTYQYGEEVTLTAIPDPGWSFDSWSGDLSGDTNPATLTVLRDMHIIAIFSEENYTLALNIVGNGSVSKDPSQVIYHYGDEVTLTATPDSGWGFDGWSGDLSGITNPASLVMDGHKTVTAIFEWQHDLTVNTVGLGSVVLDPPGGIYSHDTVVQLTAIAEPGWAFTGWSGDLSGTDNPSLLTLDRDKTVTASFIYPVHLPLILSGWPPRPSVPSLNPIDNADGDGSYTVGWSTSSDAEIYILQEATSGSFSDATIIYSGPHTNHLVSGRGAARYYYRVKALNIWAESGWSNLRQVDVLWEAEPNDDALTEANGPIVPNLVYYGTFLNADDVDDYYFFDLTSARRVYLWLTNIPAGQNYDLTLRDASLTVRGYSGNLSNSDEYIPTGDILPAGRYYIQVYHRSSGGSTQPYNLRFVLE